MNYQTDTIIRAVWSQHKADLGLERRLKLKQQKQWPLVASSWSVQHPAAGSLLINPQEHFGWGRGANDSAKPFMLHLHNYVGHFQSMHFFFFSLFLQHNQIVTTTNWQKTWLAVIRWSAQCFIVTVQDADSVCEAMRQQRVLKTNQQRRSAVISLSVIFLLFTTMIVKWK